MSYTVLIADDEPRICTSLRRRVIELPLPISRVMIAGDGTTAVAMVCREPVDILLVDIRMPGMDGLEVITEVRKLGRAIEVIVVSGFAEFAYARRAIAAGVREYLVKPVQTDELARAMASAVETLERGRISGGDGARYGGAPQRMGESSLVNRCLVEDPPPAHIESRVCLVRPSAAALARISRGDLHQILAPALARSGIDVYLDMQCGRQLLFLPTEGAGSPTTRIRDELHRLLGDRPWFGSWTRRPAALSPTLYRRLTRSLIRRLVVPGSAFVETEDGVSLSPTTTALLTEAVEVLSVQLARNAYAEAIETLKRSFAAAGVSAVSDAIWALMDAIDGRLRAGFAHEMASIPQPADLLPEADTLDDLATLYLGQIASQAGQAGMALGATAADRVRLARRYIDSNFTCDLSVPELADSCAVSPNYFSALFKAEAGESFSQYVNRLRIDRACSLLRRGVDSLSTISAACGFRDLHYFHRVFKARMGVSPLSYRLQSE